MTAWAAILYILGVPTLGYAFVLLVASGVIAGLVADRMSGAKREALVGFGRTVLYAAALSAVVWLVVEVLR